MAWRQQKQTSANSNSDSSDNRFNKFFKKTNNSSTNEPRFINKRYDSNFENNNLSEENNETTETTETTETSSQKSSYHEGFDPTLDNEMRNRQFQNNNYSNGGSQNRSDGRSNYNSGGRSNYNSDGRSNYNSDGRSNYNSDGRSNYNSDRRSNYNSGGRSNYNSDGRSNYNSDRRRNTCNNFERYGNCKFGDSCRFSHDNPSDNQQKSQQSFKLNSYEDKINKMNEELISDKYISKSKKEEMKAEILELEEKKKNEFPSLENKVSKSDEPILKNTCWGSVAGSQVLSNEGVEEANKNTKRKMMSDLAKKKQEQRKVYDQHVESDFEGDDFFENSEEEDSLLDEEFYGEEGNEDKRDL